MGEFALNKLVHYVKVMQYPIAVQAWSAMCDGRALVGVVPNTSNSEDVSPTPHPPTPHPHPPGLVSPNLQFSVHVVLMERVLCII